MFLFNPFSSTPARSTSTLAPRSLHLTFKILSLNQIRDIVIIIVIVIPAVLFVAAVPVPAAAAVLFLQALVALGQFAQRRQTVRPKLVENPRDEFGEFLVFARAVDGEGVGGDRGVDWRMEKLVSGTSGDGRIEGEQGRVRRLKWWLAWKM